jgi:hypothetical protein
MKIVQALLSFLQGGGATSMSLVANIRGYLWIRVQQVIVELNSFILKTQRQMLRL